MEPIRDPAPTWEIARSWASCHQRYTSFHIYESWDDMPGWDGQRWLRSYKVHVQMWAEGYANAMRFFEFFNTATSARTGRDKGDVGRRVHEDKQRAWREVEGVLR
eukprot:54881-Eustigmatos_ZCMA.PRE.1